MAKLLIIEDETIVRESLIELLELEDYTVFGAVNGQEGLTLAQNIIPDLIISDIAMPIMNGYELLVALKKEEKTSTIPIIFLTAKADIRDIRYGMQIGADDYLTKPFNKNDLFAAINSRLSKVETITKINDNKISDLKLKLATILPHELRTPLNGIISASQFLIMNKGLEESELNQFHNTIYNSANRLNRLIVNYLLYAETELIKNNTEILNNMKISIIHNNSRLIKEIVEKKLNEVNRIDDLELILDESPIKIDEDYFIKICEELIDNSVKFSESGLRIIIEGKKYNNSYQLKFTNQLSTPQKIKIDEIGAYNQDKRNIFEQQGSGMGLVIIKNLMSIYNGKINVINHENFVTIVLEFQTK
ncbi:MAG: hybrid sensor histidine kinase/response regulator [Candidatus Kapaibacteriota bacterium]|jgi:two-component system sensor histidine kinase/response regulator